MAFLSPRMSLKVWNSSSDPYDHEQLADNFIKVDQHDHSQGRGMPIGGDGIRDGAITSRHIYPGTLGDDAIAVENRIPIGAVLDYYSATPASYQAALGAGFRVCDGTVVIAQEHAIPGVVGSFTLPNLIGKVTVGADPAKGVGVASSVGNALANSPGVNGVGGSNATHSHVIKAHKHAISDPGHGHNVSDPGHGHGISDPGHGHNMGMRNLGGSPPGMIVNGNLVLSGTLNSGGGGSVINTIQNNGSFTYGVGIDGAGTGVTVNGSGTGVGIYGASTGITRAGPSTGINADVDMSSDPQDGRMAHVGLLKIMRVK